MDRKEFMKGGPMAKKAVKSAVSGKKGISSLDDAIEEVQARAYEVFLDREKNGIPGNEISDWCHAENDVKMKYGIR